MAAIALAILGAIADHSPAHADGGASARSQAAADETAQAHAQRILRILSDRHANNWVRYWQARYACDAAVPHDTPDAAPLDRVLLTLTAAICARIDARLGVNPAAYPPRGEDGNEGLLLSEPGAALGYTLFTPDETGYVYLIDPLGRIAHEWHLGNAFSVNTIGHANLLDNGNLLMLILTGIILEIDPRGNIIWQYDAARLHHDFLKMPNGNILLLAAARKTREQAIAAGANPEFVRKTGIDYDYLVEVRPTGASGGEIIWEWSPWDHLIQDFDPSKPNYGAIAEHPELIDINFVLETAYNSQYRILDWLHTNAIDYNPELDQIMLSPRHFSELWIIDHSPTAEDARGNNGGNGGMGGDLLYRWGNPRAYEHGDVTDQRLFWQHQTHWIPPGLPGAGNILLFNNGLEFPGYKRYYSSVDEIIPPVDGYRYHRNEDAAYPPANPTWTYAAETPANFYAPILSGAQRLPNGNTLIVDGPEGTVFQVTPNGRTAWKYIVPLHYHISLWQNARTSAWLTYGTLEDPPIPVAKNRMYRAYWYPPDHPGLQALDLTPGSRLADYPDLLDFVRAAIITGDFGERLANAPYDIYLDNDGGQNILIYFMRHCAAEDTRARFFLHIFPSDTRDIPDHRQKYGFNNMDFRFVDRGKSLDGLCVAIVPLPLYPVERIRTGQFVSGEGRLWQTEINLNEQP